MTTLLEIHGLSKSFGGARALDAVELELRAGEVHGLLGQNGSGKSTLLKVLSGFHQPDEGRLAMRGEPVALPLAPGAYRALGMAFVHQDLGLVPELSVCENLIVARLGAGVQKTVRWRVEHARAAEALERHGLGEIDTRAKVASLSQMQRALLAIVRAVEELRDGPHEHQLLVLDEPTAFLPRAGIEQLFALVRGLVEHGASVLFVTHDLDEVVELCDRVTVLRDGRLAGTTEVSATDADALVELIVGRRLAALAQRPPADDAAAAAAAAAVPARLRARGVRGRYVDGIDLEVRPGEILGVTGLLGSGFEELPHLLFGSRPATGTLTLTRHDGASGRDRSGDPAPDQEIALERLTPGRAVGLGLAFVPSDRPLDGAVGALSIADNLTMTTLPEHRRGPLLSRRSMREKARELGERFAVVPNDPSAALSALSGGNQQKVVLAKWLQRDPRVLLLDQPTQGVDVQARRQLFDAISGAARRGSAVLCASADYEELAALCDRLLIVARGRVVRELRRSELSKERIAEHVLTSTTMPAADLAETHHS
ncbi:sugar ABC transporter ATP-binding protein [Conexibacter sp. CPCC 206217]|uniref:sugar ABC transporter ATP-binding protein n=1 Tax=Conexibacter sp. CPCC 206217 TaxID=3064574 RepID=UPI00271BC4BD|nr:sugar ABC transporter ATP-binding protein [Conexibacter sp. CPCC 206217]MDO8213288.1 sugar ABC transporter ATP-binding protein [Conexibacter sp. CPCC 206217]